MAKPDIQRAPIKQFPIEKNFRISAMEVYGFQPNF